LSERRHRISGRELPHVVTAITNQLREWLQYRRVEDRYGAEHLFKLWWRIQIHRIGQPCYPDFSWGVVEQYLGEPMVPNMEADESG